MLELNLTRKIKLPRVFNYLKVGDDNDLIDLGELSDNDLETLAEIYKQHIIEHGKQRRKRREH